MKTSNTAENNIAYALPFETLMFTAEMKNYIGKSTIRGLFISITMITMFIAAFLLFLQSERIIPQAPILQHPGPTTLIDIQFIENPLDFIKQLSLPKDIIIGYDKRAGNPIPIPDALIRPDVGEFAPVNEMTRSLHEAGNSDGNPYSGNGNTGIDVPKKVNMQPVTREEEKVVDYVDKPPVVDLERLQKLVIYPKLAKDARIEGRVTVGILVSKTGIALKYSVLYSENELLNDAALSAVKAYGRIEPGIQSSTPVACWVYIPIQFRLK